MNINKLMENIGLFNCLCISNYNPVKWIKTNFRANVKNSDNAERWERPDRTSKRKKIDLENVAFTMKKKSIESIHSSAKKNTKIKEKLEQHLLNVDKKKNKLNEREQRRALETLKDESEERELNKFQAEIQKLHRQIINNIAHENEEIKNIAQDNEEIKNIAQDNEEIKNMDQDNEEIKNMDQRGIEDERDRFEQDPIDTEEEINQGNGEESDSIGPKRRTNYSHLWVQCETCYGVNYKSLFDSKLYICEWCQAHVQMNSLVRINFLVDPDTWVPMDEDMISDPIAFDSVEEVKPFDFVKWESDMDELIENENIPELNLLAEQLNESEQMDIESMRKIEQEYIQTIQHIKEIDKIEKEFSDKISKNIIYTENKKENMDQRGIEDERDRFEQDPIDTEEEINQENDEFGNQYHEDDEESNMYQEERDKFEEERDKFEEEKFNRFFKKVQIESSEEINKINKKKDSDKNEIDQKLKEIVDNFKEEKIRFKLDLYIVNQKEEKLEEEKSKLAQEKKEMEKMWFTEHKFRRLEYEKYILKAEKSRLKEEREKFEEENRLDSDYFYMEDYEDHIEDYENDLEKKYEFNMIDYISEYYMDEESVNSNPEQEYKKINGYSLNEKRDRLNYFIVIDLGDGVYRNLYDELDRLMNEKFMLEIRKKIYNVDLYIFEKNQARVKIKIDIFDQYIRDIRKNLEKIYKNNI